LTVEETVELNSYWGFLLAYRIAKLNQTKASRLVLQAKTYSKIKTLHDQNECANCGEQHRYGRKCKPINSNSPQTIDSFVDNGKNLGYIMGLKKLIVQPPTLIMYANVSRNPEESFDYPVSETGLSEEEIRGSNLYKLILRRTEKIQKTHGLFIIEYAESSLLNTGNKCLIFHLISFLQIVKEATRFWGLSVVVALVPND
jgi:ribosomal protein L32